MSAPPAGSREQRAAAAGIATEYEDWAHHPTPVAPDDVDAVLAAFGPVNAGPPPTVVVRDGRAPQGTVLLEDGSVLPAGAEVPVGYHRLQRPDGSEATLISAPAALRQPDGRLWGWAVQLWALRSARSWGRGDYRDLADVAVWAAERGADLVLVNPLHVAAPGHPVERSPYSPSSRRVHDVGSIAVDLLPEWEDAGRALRARVAALRPPQRVLIDPDEAWAAREAAFALLAPRDLEPPADPVVRQWCTWAALAEVHGADWRTWPAALQEPGPAADAAADEGRVAFHGWLQQRAAEQLTRAQQHARAAGMRVGIVHDLAVGVHPGGADAWALSTELVRGMTVGAPPDSFNQKGQDWQLPPLHPQRIAETGYAAFRDVVRAALHHGGGLRLDHVMGLWRLWWVPEGRTPDHGTYVSYDADAMLAVVAVEATRSGALVLGEDLGTVQPAVNERLAAEDVLGCDVLWFCTDPDTGAPLPSERWRARAAASISTHDLPTAYGWLAGEPVRVRAELGLLGVSREEEQARLDAEHAAWRALLVAEGLLERADAPDDAVVLALHRLVARTPARVVLAAFGDATGDLNQPNLPGTVPLRDPYPSWCLPVADRAGRPLGLETLRQHPGVAAVVAAVVAERAAPRPARRS
ncbi:MAG TPA: 4-alpha-glucanotransferase [Mycobacteriales bacterium]|nr:4-alpha-glucanotransferase [Mycobacteriales bacterium]